MRLHLNLKANSIKDFFRPDPALKFNNFNYFKLGWSSAFTWKNILINLFLPFILLFFVVGFKYIILYSFHVMNKPINTESALSMLLNYLFYGHIIFLLLVVAYKQVNPRIRLLKAFFKNFGKVILWEIPLVGVFFAYQVYFNVNGEVINQLLTGGNFLKLTIFLTIPLMGLYLFTLFSLYFFVFLAEKENYHLRTKNSFIAFFLCLRIAFANKKHLMFLTVTNTFLSFALFIPFPVYFMFKLFFETGHMSTMNNFIALAATVLLASAGTLFPVMATLRGVIINFNDYQKTQVNDKNKLTIGTSYGQHKVQWKDPE